MLVEGMYVRCPADIESVTDPRVFVCGQVIKVDEFKKTVKVKIYDPFSYLLFFEELPQGIIELPLDVVRHCTLFLNSDVFFKKEQCIVLSCAQAKDGFYYYFLQNKSSKTIFRVCEKNILAAFNNGRVDPAEQLKSYEFQNPCWFLGHSIVSKSMNILNNSIYGFKDLAGSKIYLLAHQINTIMRCLQEDPCRYMLADEVGMGKTIEAISVFKIYMKDRSNQKALVIVPETLKEQWKTELFLKFNIEQGEDIDHNSITVKTVSEISVSDIIAHWDFVIIDEVHRYLTDQDIYDMLHLISKNTKNILLLSATPVQQRQEEYLSLLQLLLPKKYDSFSLNQFKELVEKQSHIIQKTALLLDDLGDFEDEINEVIEEEEDPHDSEDCQDFYEEIYEGLEEICDDLNDDKLNLLFKEIDIANEDLGVYAIKVIISYICSNYQIESNIIRNRRKLLEKNDDGERLLPTRELETFSYELDNDRNAYEAYTYELLSEWIIKNVKKGTVVVETQIKPLLNAFFSSPWAFLSKIEELSNYNLEMNPEIISNADMWRSYEQNIIEHLEDVIDDPDQYEEYYSTRLMTVLNIIYEEYYDQKIVLFTNYPETFNAYKKAMNKLFSEDEVSYFGASLPKHEVELNAYRFQNDKNCRIMLCDYTGGEGRNFQCADYIIHIDLPWDANMIEQRIGRLDRLERDPSRPVVHSVVIYTTDTFEESLFKFWNEGLKIFTQSLSGMEIIMKDINNEIIAAIEKDFRFGLAEKIPTIIQLAENMRLTVRKEQNFDAAGFIYRPMYNELRRLIDYYAENENELFANTMTNWASLAGLHGTQNKAGNVTYNASSFVPKSAINALLIPPRWNDYVNSAQNTFINSVQKEYSKMKSKKNDNQAIKGTFLRKNAIENDYLHFFAPGDEVFDCIVNNAINSCKGQSSAFAFQSELNWSGIIFTWSVSPNIDYLMSKGVSIHALSPYRNYLSSEQVVIPITINNDDDISDSEVVREYNRLISMGFKNNKVIHLGKRSRSAGFLKNIILESSNIGWFRKEFSEENWDEIVIRSRKEAKEKAFDIFKRRSNIRGLKDEMERNLSAKAANADYYGLSDEGIEQLKQNQELIFAAMNRPKIVLESAAYIWMVKTEDE